MTPTELRAARRELGLSQEQLATMLGVTGHHVRRMEAEEGEDMHRHVMPYIARLLQAYLDGYRPGDWPQVGRYAGQNIPTSTDTT